MAIGLAGCRPAGSTLQLDFAVAPEDGAGFRSLRFEPGWGGVNNGPLRDENWTRVPVVAPSVAWTAADDAVVMARGEVAAGEYLRVYVETPRVTGVARDGSAVTLEAHIEPLVFPVTLPAGGRREVIIDLIVMPLPPWRGPGYGIFVKSAHLAVGG